MISKAMDSSWVTPTIIPTAQIIKLSTADQYVPKQWLPRVLFFPTTDDATHEDIYSNLREGLSRTISQYPFLAGRICRQADQSSFASVEISEHAGVDFFCKDYTVQNEGATSEALKPPSYSELKDSHFPMENLAAWGAPKALFVPVMEGGSLFVAQANFISGGLALVFGIAHLVTDAKAWATIVRTWAGHTIAAAKGQAATDLTVFDFTAEREALSQGSPNIEPSEWSTPLWTVGNIANSPCNLSNPIPPEQQVTLAQRFGQPNIRSQTNNSLQSTWRIWYLTADQLKALKVAATSLQSGAQWISTTDALFALFWIRSAIYRKSPSNGNEDNETISIAREPIDLRSRMSIAPSFVGNAVSMLETRISFNSLDPATALTTVAQSLRSSIQSFELSQVKDFMGVANKLPPDQGIYHPTPTVMAPNILLNDHSKLEVYGCDWGVGLGPLERVRGPEPDFPIQGLGLIISFPTLPDGGLEVATVFDEEVNVKLEKDEVLMKYMERRY